MMAILTIAGYKFTPLAADTLETIRDNFLTTCQTYQLLGTILLSPEGININLAGTATAIAQFKTWLHTDATFNDMTFRESHASASPYKKLKVKLKKEIITFRQAAANPANKRAPAIPPLHLKKWLDEKQDILLLDARNAFEVSFGTFEGADFLPLQRFSELPEHLSQLNRKKTIVTFCTSGIRCEKAALYLLDNGFEDVYQLEGGILNYFAQAGGAHYQGDCFVFDNRIAVQPDLSESQNHLVK